MSENAPDYIRIHVNREKHLMHSIWLRDVSSEQLRAGVLQFLQIIQQEDIWYWIVDARLLRSPSVTDQRWILKEVSPVLIASNLRKLARIGNSDVFTYMAYENIVEKTHEQFTVKTAFAQFTTYEAALNWINLID
ncbi:hypothetical protein I2I11_14200 [Pontibacter sp. 172403-2]|uniref:hypothetical protein n=1 Tax=Pontibacter rufus TaxID=2791028 RepID=UPI0018AF8930|nr:hypothetical protein [Pontibacter sp. 172403-2]MBF9254452.1 hypothetical protein [Pontibacter sp. 172403-2]